ncbi:MAG: carboxymethylenebutenolidase [Gammaproteobacteria bacterium RIFCSPLOWO2_02_FULL_61_13]|nr:MAG: carboxymethylenebutenolidase [Gammaproteobacteria bacterium RIFCSPLOWO2_02_FULL_61_13]
MSNTIELKTADAHVLSAYASGPADAAAGLVVLQEIFGVNRHMRHVCDTFAEAGYRVISPALFDRVERGVEMGYAPEDSLRGRELRAKITEANTIADIEASAAWLGNRKIGIIGYCWGGTVAWLAATRTKSFRACAAWYGTGIAAARNENPNCPVQLHFGEKDPGIPPADIEAIRKAHPELESFVYAGAGHGFGCEERSAYVKADAEVAQRRTLEFFKKHLV